MRVHRVLVVLLLAVTLVAISGCIEFGAIQADSPTPTPISPSVDSNSATPRPQIFSSQVSVTLNEVTSTQTSDGQQSKNLVLTLKNTGTTDVTSVRLTYEAEDSVADDLLSSGSVSVGSIAAGGRTEVTVSVPRYEHLRAMIFSVAVCWGDDPEYVNDKIRQWSISLVTNQFWEK